MNSSMQLYELNHILKYYSVQNGSLILVHTNGTARMLVRFEKVEENSLYGYDLFSEMNVIIRLPFIRQIEIPTTIKIAKMYTQKKKEMELMKNETR